MSQYFKGFKIVFFMLFLVTVNSKSYSQKIRPFVGAGGFFQMYSFEKDRETSPAISFSAGAEYRATSFLLPEIEVNYMFGDLKDKLNSTSQNNIERSFSSVSFSICPKIVLGDYNDSSYFQILPKYTYSIIDSKETTTTNSVITTEKEKNISTSQSSIGLGVGCVINFEGWYSNSLAVNLVYKTVNIPGTFNKLNNLAEEKYSDNAVFGIEFNYYFGVKRLR